MTGPSRTSVFTALARAFGAREPDPRVRNPDDLAALLCGDEERTLLGDHPLVLAMTEPYEEAYRKPEVVAVARSMIPRTRFIDERLEAAVRDGAGQVVVLGAGFDSRAYRFSELLTGRRVFEVDHPATQEVKMRRVRQALGEPPANLSYIPVDFRHDDLGDKLSAAGYRRDLESFFIWEGVTMYLPAAAVASTLTAIPSNAPPGSAVVFDYTYETVIHVMQNPDAFPIPAPLREGLERFRKIATTEPWIFGIPDGQEREFLGRFGLEVTQTLGFNSADAVTRYLTRGDGTVFGDFPATDREGYLILEARVA